jgi:hypothetical protein
MLQLVLEPTLTQETTLPSRAPVKKTITPIRLLNSARETRPKTTSPWKCRRTPNRQTDPPPLQDLPSPKKHNDNKSAPLSASLQKPRQAHLLPTPMSSVSSLYVSHSDPPLPLPVCTSQKNTLLCRPRTPSCFPLMVKKCNAMILTPRALSYPA